MFERGVFGMMGAQYYYCTDLISYPSPYYCTFCKGFICTPQVTCLEGKGKLRGGRRLPKARPTRPREVDYFP